MSQIDAVLQNLEDMGKEFDAPIDKRDINDMSDLAGTTAMIFAVMQEHNLELDDRLIMLLISESMQVTYNIGRLRGQMDKGE